MCAYFTLPLFTKWSVNYGHTLARMRMDVAHSRGRPRDVRTACRNAWRPRECPQTSCIRAPAGIHAIHAHSRECTSVIYWSLSKLRQCKISTHSHDKLGKVAIFSLIQDFWQETSGGKIAPVRAHLDGFEKVFLRNVRNTEIYRIAFTEFRLVAKWATYKLLQIPNFGCGTVWYNLV